MSFLDNLESNLKSLESREEAQDERSHQNRAASRARALAEAPWAEELKKGAFTEDLLRQATRLGFAKRLKVRPVWIGTTLRLEAGSKRLELRPTPTGIVAAILDSEQSEQVQPVDLGVTQKRLPFSGLVESGAPPAAGTPTLSLGDSAPRVTENS